jgi:pimeloyl-ACP methyl ester carboxylesterase
MPFLNHKGSQFYFEECGRGEKTILFLHGTAGKCNYFAKQLTYFGLTHRAIAMDLRGHGLSDSTHCMYSIQSFSEDILSLLDHLQLNDVTLVGHSLGGLIAIDLASRVSNRIESAILLDTPLLIPDQISKEIEEISANLRTEQYSDCLRDFASQFFFTSESDLALRNRVLSDLLGFPQERFLGIWDAMPTFDAAEALKACRIPMLYVHGNTPTDLNRLQALVPSLVVSQIPNSGHYLYLESPLRLNMLIAHFLAQVDNLSTYATKVGLDNLSAMRATTV